MAEEEILSLNYTVTIIVGDLPVSFKKNITKINYTGFLEHKLIPLLLPLEVKRAPAQQTRLGIILDQPFPLLLNQSGALLLNQRWLELD